MRNSHATNVPQSTSDHLALFRVITMIVGVQFFFLSSATMLLAQKSSGTHSALWIESLKGRLRVPSVIFTVHCKSEKEFTGGSIVCKTITEGKSKSDTLTIWKGNSDSANFDCTVHYALQPKEGTRGHIEAIFSGMVAGARITAKREIYACTLGDTLLLNEKSYSALDQPEVDYLIRKKGYQQKSEDEIKGLDPELWKKMQKLKPQGETKKK